METGCGFPRTGFRGILLRVFFFWAEKEGGSGNAPETHTTAPFSCAQEKGGCDVPTRAPRLPFSSLSKYTKKRSFSFFAKSKRVTKGSSVVIVNITALPSDKNQETWAKREDLYTLGRESDPTQPFRKNNCSRSAERGTESQHHANIR